MMRDLANMLTFKHVSTNKHITQKISLRQCTPSDKSTRGEISTLSTPVLVSIYY